MDVDEDSGEVFELQRELTKEEKALRKKFVRAYLDCRDPYQACLRIGYQKAFAEQYAVKFMQESFTLALIKKGEEHDEFEDVDEVRKWVLRGFRKEAVGAYEPRDRISALAHMAKVSGAEAPIKIDQRVTTRAETSELAKKLSSEELEAIEAILKGVNERQAEAPVHSD